MDEQLVEALKTELPDASIEVFGDRAHVFTAQPHGMFERFLERHSAENVTIRNANLEDVFLKLTGRKLKE
jgi:lipooligosaccharide transport system ATP-binding protein